jgi:putative FmdB family regulatory protein
MPTYEYVCKECGEGFEVVQSFDAPSLSTCAACGGSLRKVFGNVGIVFKGSGFYKTDSRSSNGKGSSSTPDSDKASTTSTNSEGAKEPVAASSSAGSASSSASPPSTAS